MKALHAWPPVESGFDRRMLARNSTVYREFLAEKAEILRHKWLMSEQAGRDVGFDVALIDWVRHHRSTWYAYRRTQRAASQGS